LELPGEYPMLRHRCVDEYANLYLKFPRGISRSAVILRPK
jgi:hypothetical protein